MTVKPGDEIHTKVRGVTRIDPHSRLNRQVIIQKYVRKGTPLIVNHEVDNPEDPNALALWLQRKGLLRKRWFHLGYIGRALAHQIAPLMVNGHHVDAVVSEVTGGKGKSRGLNLIVYVR